jgi:HEPN domain-containing protein
MAHDTERIAETEAWFARATEDLAAARLLLSTDRPLVAAALFHAQQATEKAMKGFLTWHDRPFRKTHNLVEIGELCVSIDATLEALLRRAAVLTEYAWRFRYPGESRSPSGEESREALALAHEVYAAIHERLPGDVRADAQ